jgi:DNA-directed RNA polymerase subunit RPC12/RpoP
MGLIQLPIRPIQISYECDACKEGSMHYTGQHDFSDINNPTFTHECTKCKVQMLFKEKYPTVRYAKEGELLDLSQYTPQKL